MKKILPYLIILLIIGILAFIKIMFLSSGENKGKDMMQGKPKVTLVTATVAKLSKLNNDIFVSGNILANESVDLVPETAGKITQINFKEGSAVSKGALLIKINDADLVAQLKKNQLKVKLATEKEVRQKKLLEINGISQEEYDATVTELNSANADVELLQAQIAKTEIHAPFNGVIGLRNVSEGSYVNQTTKIASIQQTDPLKIDFYVPEKYAPFVKVNDSLTFSVEGNDAPHKAIVIAVEPKVDDVTRTVQIRAIAHNYSGKILPGASARIMFSPSTAEDAVMIPTQAVIPILKGQKVFVCRNGMAQETIIKTGLRNETSVQVIEGITPGDTVITTGIMQLKPGSPVKFTSIQ